MNNNRFFAQVMRLAGYTTEDQAAAAARAVLSALGDELSDPGRSPQARGVVIKTLTSELSPSGRHLLVAVLPDETAEKLVKQSNGASLYAAH